MSTKQYLCFLLRLAWKGMIQSRLLTVCYCMLLYTRLYPVTGMIMCRQQIVVTIYCKWWSISYRLSRNCSMMVHFKEEILTYLIACSSFIFKFFKFLIQKKLSSFCHLLSASTWLPPVLDVMHIVLHKVWITLMTAAKEDPSVISIMIDVLVSIWQDSLMIYVLNPSVSSVWVLSDKLLCYVFSKS